MSALALSGTTRWLIRLHRPALYVWTGLLVALAAVLLSLWGPLADAAAEGWRAYNSCTGGGTCRYDQNAMLRYKDVYTYTTGAVLALPFLVAAWAGGALTGREMESGTAQLAWTQNLSPARWLTAKLALPAVLVTGGTGLLVWLYHSMWKAADHRVDSVKYWADWTAFYAGGLVTVALALAALLIGAVAGLLLRRSLAALGVAAVAVGALWLGLNRVLPHLWPSVTRTAGLNSGDRLGAGLTISRGYVTADGRRTTDLDQAVASYHEFQPLSHYWPLQLTATAVLLAVTALLALTAYRVTVVRHRAGA